jgi:hypothetical protein
MRIAIALMALALTACELDGGSCPEPQPLDYFASGTFHAPGGDPIDYYCTSGCSAVFTPHDGVDDLEMELDMEASVAIIRYVAGGQQIEERWTITRRESR